MSPLFFLTGLSGFASGVLLRSFFIFDWPGIAFVALIGVLFLGAWFFLNRRLYALVSICCIAAALGASRTALVPETLPETFVPFIGTEVSFVGTVVADPDIRETGSRIMVEVTYEGQVTRVLAVASPYTQVRYGEKVFVSGLLALPQPFDTNGGRVFRYDRYLAKDGVFALVERASVTTTAPREGIVTAVMGALSDGKRSFLAALSDALPEPHAALAGGLVAGGKQGLGAALLQAFIVSGLIHIVVLSGYNVMIVASGVLFALAFLPRRFAASLATFTIGAFVLAAGAGPASVRAGLMAGLALFARASGRTYDALRALTLIFVLMLLWNPLLLAYDIGFELSFVATLGLIIGTPLLEIRLAFVRSPFIREIMATTVAAQIAVLPLLLYQNGLFSLVALPANLLVLPVVPLAMATSAFAGFIALLIPAFATIAGLPAYALLSYIVGVVNGAASLPFAALSLPAFPFAFVVVAYAALAWFVFSLKKRTPAGTAFRTRSS